MTNVELARFNMVEQQVRPWDVLDPQVLDLIQTTPREAYVPDSHKNIAYADVEIPIGNGEVMLSPKHAARMLQALDVQANDIALEVGTGTGYITALLAQTCRHVFSVDLDGELSTTAASNLAAQDIRNITLETGCAASGWNKDGPYDVTIITGALPELPQSFKDSMQRGGRLIAIIGTAPVMEARAKQALPWLMSRRPRQDSQRCDGRHSLRNTCSSGFLLCCSQLQGKRVESAIP